MLSIFPATYDREKISAPQTAIRDRRTFMTGWLVLMLLLVGFSALEPLGTRLCRPSEAVLALLPDPQQGPFTKEDGDVVIPPAP